jgi:hypothetical protein
MDNYVKVDGHSSLVRDEETTAIVNTDIEAYYLAKKRKEMFISQRKEINTLKEDVTEIKSLLVKIIEKIDG